MASNRDASETSPLLSRNRNDNTGQINTLPINGGLTADSADASGDLERRESLDKNRAAQFQGAPEIQKQLKYILPALSVGVWRIISRTSKQELTYSDIPVRGRPNHHCFHIWKYRQRP